MKLDNRVAIITGAGRGIGKAIALTFAKEGANLVLASCTLPEVEATADEVRSLGRRALALKADVSRRSEVEAMIASTVAEFGRIDVLVNNAAVQAPIGTLWENDPDEWLRTVLINLGGVFLCCQAVVPVMIRQAGGEIINLSGGGAASPRPYFTAYAASKAAVARLTETLAEEVKAFNIRVNAIGPGGVYTAMTEEVLAAGSSAGERELAEATKVKEDCRTAEAASELALFLASGEGERFTGKVISAVWDDWRGATRNGENLAPDAWTLRRVPLSPEASPSFRHSFYEQDFGSAGGNAHDLLAIPRLRKVLQIASRRRAEEFLDVGCGDGTVTLKLKEILGAKVARGVDISAQATELAKGKGVEAVQVDLDNQDLPFPADSFGFVLCAEVMEHVFDPGRLLSEIRRVLKPGGLALVTTPNLASWYNRLAILLGFQPWSHSASLEDLTAGKFLGKTWADGGGGHLRTVTSAALHDLLRARGFTGIRVHGAPSVHTFGAMPVPLRLPVSLVQMTLGRIPSLATTLIAEATAQK